MWEELQARRAQARHDTDAISKSLRHARVVAETYGQLVAERAQRSEKVTAAEAQYKEIKQRIDAIKSTELELGEARKALETLKGEIPLKEREVQEREQEAARLKAALEDARKGRRRWNLQNAWQTQPGGSTNAASNWRGWTN